MFLSQNTSYLTPWSRVPLKLPTVVQPRMEFPAFYGTRRFVTMFTTARHWFLSRATWIQSTSLIPFSKIHLTSFSHHCLGLLICLFPSGFPTKALYALFSRASYMPWPSHHPWLDHSNHIQWREHVMKLLTVQFSPHSYQFHPSSQTLSVYVTSRPCSKPIQNYKENYSFVYFHFYVLDGGREDTRFCELNWSRHYTN
jgi:hypothetical protein